MSRETLANLENLWAIGSYHLPVLAVTFGEAAGKVHQTRSHDSGLLETPGGADGAKSPVFDSFSELRDLLQQVARNTCINLRDSGAGCVAAADAFSERDLSNSERLEYAETNEEFNDRNKVTPPENPPAVPAR